ncbi:hypothetical protein [Flavobacterium resistens]|nr:hypothetical protein [Flavobacterium resistens]
MFYINSQKIIDKNQFKEYAFLGLLLVALNFFLQIFINNNDLISFVLTGFPFFYIVYFRLLLFLFYNDFAASYKRPKIFFASRSKWSSGDLEYDYIATNKEILFSRCLFFGPLIFVVLAVYFIIRN